jgi:hypothetical protein
MDERVTPCECLAPGWCPRHRCHKLDFWFELCRRRQDYFNLWETGSGPLQKIAMQRAPLPRCRFRGLDPVDTVLCEICGQRDVSVAVFACGIFGQCTERRYGNSTERARQMPACLSCDRYLTENPDETVVSHGDDGERAVSPRRPEEA